MHRSPSQRFGNFFLLGLLLLSLFAPPTLWAQGASPLMTPTLVAPTTSVAANDAMQQAQQALADHINAVFTAMSPADRVGQLFVITFDGNQITRNSDIVELIHQERIGGVVLSPARHNFTNTKGEDTPAMVARLTNQLQALTYGYLVPPNLALSLPLTAAAPFSGSSALPPVGAPAIPLLIGVEQLGDGFPKTALRRGFTMLPSQMALGATWNPTLVQGVGAIVGQELQAVGVNLLLGPNLDVVDKPRNDPVGALGLYSFGGDPYWVSQLGRAYIAGVHIGSGNRVAVIAHHFPGQGDIDRVPDQEVATVQKSLAELAALALPPFRNVTRQISPLLSPAGDPSAADGLMTSHMRFSALQGVTPGRATPLSLSLDLKLVIADHGLGDWYGAGGLMMTNGLGLPAIRSYYEATMGEFSYKRVANDAFVAGHDLLYLAHEDGNSAWATEKAQLKEVLKFFRDRYESDPEFRTQVDRAVQRILRLKLGFYQEPLGQQSGEGVPLSTTRSLMLAPPAQVLRRSTDLALFAEGSEHRAAAADMVGQVTRAAITLLYPDVANLSDVIANPPQIKDQLLIFSDSRLFNECEGCIAETTLGPEKLKTIITRLYGAEPGATGQIDPERIYDRSFVELATLLDATATTIDPAATTTPAAITETWRLTNSQPMPTPINDALGDNGVTPPAEVLTANERLQQLINDSNWIIFAMLDVDPKNQSGNDVVKRFLRQQSEQLGDKQVIVLALNAPYFLDATEISKLTAYFGVYSKTQPALESAIRAIFRSSTPTGAPPVSVPGTRFDNLSARLGADAARPLALTLAAGEPPQPLPAPADGSDPVILLGEPLRLEVNNILDHNGHPVPDGVEVEFQLVDEARNINIPVPSVMTRNGSASQTVTFAEAGRLLLSASVGDAQTAAPLAVRIQEPTAAPLNTNVAPTVTTIPITTPQNAPTVITVTIPATTPVAANPANTPLATVDPQKTGVDLATLAIAFLTILVTLSFLLILQIHILPRTMLMQNMLWAAIFGLSAYILYGLGILPGVSFLQETLRVWAAAVVVFIGMLLPLLWLQLRAE